MWGANYHVRGWSGVMLQLVLGVVIVTWVTAQDPMSPLIRLNQGVIRGVRMYTDTRVPVNAFLGIPYVAAPVGNLRFATPQRHQGWNGTLTATTFGPACPQVVSPKTSESGGVPGVSDFTETSEDCLFVNVWAPELGSGSYRGFPVVVFFEGDGFVSGWPGRFPGHELAAEGLVVISASYRLNLFGFLCLGSSESRGNMGLLDQYLALLWVRENVEAFGGDKGSVTLLGHGAGAASALLHASSPRTRGLFQRVVALSGSPLAPWAGGQRGAAPVVLASREVAMALGCLADTAARMLGCLRTKHPGEIVRIFQNLYQGGNWSEIPLPVTDDFLPGGDRYLPTSPREALHTVTVPVLLGSASHDGVAALASWGELARQGFEPLLRFAERAAVPSLTVQSGLTRRSATVRELLTFQYLSRARHGDAEALLQQLIQMYTDAYFRAPIAQAAATISEGGAPVYRYLLGASKELPGADLIHHSGIKVSGASHGTELLILLGPGVLARALGRRLTAAEDRLAAAIRRLLLDFVRHGNPTPGSYGYGASWRRFFPSEGAVMSLESQNTLVQPLATEGEALWNSLFPRLATMPMEMDSGRNNELGGELRDEGSGGAYRSTAFALGGVAAVLAGLLTLSLALLRWRSSRHKDSAEDAF